MASVAGKLMSAEEFFDWANRPENRERVFELEAGEIVEMSRPSELHCAICGNVTWILGNYVRQRKKGYVCPNDMGLVLQRDPDMVRGVDVALYVESRKYDDLAQKFSERLPELALEVLSPTDRLPKVSSRINEFLASGVALVWLLDPGARTVTVWRAGQPPETLDTDKELTGFDVLPEFSCKVVDLFAIPGEEN